MGHNKIELPLEESHEEHVKRRLQVLYTRQTHERQVFMQELKEYRNQREKKMLKSIKRAVGPRWYQALSVPQRSALDSLEFCIYQDVLEGRPHRTFAVMRALGLFPRPNRSDLMNCIYLGREDPKEMLAQLYNVTFGYTIEGKRASYSLNARLMLSAIFYLGLDQLIEALRERFRPDEVKKELSLKPKPRPEPPPASPYLQKMVAALWVKPVYKRPPPAPLPNLDDLDDPYEEEPFIQKPSPPPPPPPPPKRRMSRSICDALANVQPIVPHEDSESDTPVRRPIKASRRKSRSSKGSIPEGKKVYGLGLGTRKGKGLSRRRKPVAPSTGLDNAQYTINGVFEINGKAMFVLGNVTILPADGEFIHGGHASLDNKYITINCGYRGRPPTPKADPCDCQKKWHDAVFQYIKDNKCYCGHRYDFGNEGTFPPDELPYFMKPTRNSPLAFNYHTIFDLDPKQLHVEKEFKKIWETDSILHIDDGTLVIKKDSKKKKKRSSKTCLGAKPKPEDYLKCAIRFMRRGNVSARLPDLHLVPELKEWMRKRLYGPLTRQDKAVLLRKSTTYWRFFNTLAERGYGHVSPPKDPEYIGHTNWLHKQKLSEKFRHYTHKYRLAMFRSHAYIINLLWRTMYQAELPDKKFRQIYFSYLYSRMEDLLLIQPYSSKEAKERQNLMLNNRYICLPAGYDTLET